MVSGCCTPGTESMVLFVGWVFLNRNKGNRWQDVVNTFPLSSHSGLFDKPLWQYLWPHEISQDSASSETLESTVTIWGNEGKTDCKPKLVRTHEHVTGLGLITVSLWSSHVHPELSLGTIKWIFKEILGCALLYLGIPYRFSWSEWSKCCCN